MIDATYYMIKAHLVSYCKHFIIENYSGALKMNAAENITCLLSKRAWAILSTA